MSIIDEDLNKFSLKLDFYSLIVSPQKKETFITMSLNTAHFHTNAFPRTYSILEKTIPGIFRSKCFNDEDLPFSQEVLNTEIGHLFEHIILEYLCQIKLQKGAKKALYKGFTNWNCKKDKKVTFHIILYMNQAEQEIFAEALDKSIKVLDYILRFGDKISSDKLN
ncbi:MAG: hypothetical protein HYV38_01395 [Candidatus Levybacteria bacterium]|nr:hypothetical protein [Candidatus Levybacteria bacterium]